MTKSDTPDKVHKFEIKTESWDWEAILGAIITYSLLVYTFFAGIFDALNVPQLGSVVLGIVLYLGIDIQAFRKEHIRRITLAVFYRSSTHP